MSQRLSPRTGEVFIRNFDQGVVEMLGATVRVLESNTAVGVRKGYFLDVVGCDPIEVPVIFNNPEQVLESKIYPSFVVTRDSVDPSLARWQSVGQMEYMAGVSGTEYVSGGVSGFSQVERKAQAWPHDLNYTISCYARYEHEAITMVKAILKVFVPYSKIYVLDSLGQRRSYTVFNESGVQDIGEYVDVADRLKAYAISIRVEGELDLMDPTTDVTVDSVVNNLSKKKDKKVKKRMAFYQSW